MKRVAEVHELSSGVWVVASPVGLNPGDAGGVLCKSPHELVCATLRAAGVDPAIYLASIGFMPVQAPHADQPPPPCEGFASASEAQAAKQYAVAVGGPELNNDSCIGSSCEI